MTSKKLFHKTYYDPAGKGSLTSRTRFLKELKGKKFQGKPGEWLLGEDAYTLHKGVRKKFKRRRVVVSGIDDQFQADLVDMQKYKASNHNNHYILTVVDVFSKFAWALPLKNKGGKTVANALQDVFNQRSPRSLQTDKGKEFYNSYVKELLQKFNVHHFSTENDDIKASVVERFNQTLQKKLYRWFTKQRSNSWDTVLQSLVDGYNKSPHSSIKLAPIHVNHENEEDVWHKLYGKPTQLKATMPKLKVNDTVRISKYKHIFSKGYESNWSTEVFFVHRILSTDPVTYNLRDQNDEIIFGSYYEQELQKVNSSNTTYIIENVLKQRKRKGKIQYFVKWKNFPSSANSWVNKSQLV